MKRNNIDAAITAAVKKASMAARQQSVLKIKNVLQAGACHWANYSLLGIDEVGVVIVRFNPDSSARRALKAIKAAGYASVKEAYAASKPGTQLRKDAKEAELYFRVKYGVCKGNGVEYRKYETPFSYCGVVNGFEQVRVTRDGAFKACELAQLVDPVLNTEECLLVVRDQEAIKRLFAEKTIDSAKKPDSDIMGGIPLAKNMSRMTMMSRRNIEVVPDWDNRRVDIKGGITGESKLVRKTNKDGSTREELVLNDAWNQAIVKYMPYAKEVYTELMMAICGQQLPAKEVTAIIMAGKKHRQAVLALNLVKELGDNARAALKERTAKLRAEYGTKSYRAEAWGKAIKDENNEFYPEFRNMARCALEMAGINDPVERVRVALNAVLFKGLDSRSTVNWENLSGFVSMALDVEWQIYKLFIERENPWTPQETMNRVHFDAVLSDEELVALNGTTMTFEDGAAYDEDGEEICHADTIELNGDFVIRVADDGVYACKSITEILTNMIPAADHSRRLFITDDRTDFTRFNAFVTKKEVTLAPMQHDAILVNDGGRIVRVGGFRTAGLWTENNKPVNSRIIADLYGGKNGVRGEVASIIRGSHESKKKGRVPVAVCLMTNVHPVTDEAAEIMVPEASVDMAPAKKKYNFKTPVRFEDLGLEF